MHCLTPITLYRKDGHRIGKEYRTDVVPCGKCPACLKRRQSGWVFRLEQEQKRSFSSAFLTLTYDNKYLPISENGFPTLDKKHHQLFIKRLRKTIKTHFNEEALAPIKYYSCGEYGTKTLRPHYHSVMFNLPQSFIENPDLVTRDWQLGNTMVAICNTATIGYVTKYINKTIFTEGTLSDQDDRQKEFSLMSKGLGENYLTEPRYGYYKKLLTPYLVIENGEKRSMPRYYKDKLYNKLDQAIIQQKTLKHLEENPTFTSAKHELDYIQAQFDKQLLINTLNRQKL